MQSITPDDANCRVQAIRDLHKEIDHLLYRYGEHPERNSQAAQELQSYSHRESVEIAYNQGTMLIIVVADQAMAFSKTVTEPVQAVAPWTCIRALLEASALACWLLDPKIDAHMRVQRSFAFRYRTRGYVVRSHNITSFERSRQCIYGV
jgi:hypothetical protein